LAVKRSLP